MSGNNPLDLWRRTGPIRPLTPLHGYLADINKQDNEARMRPPRPGRVGGRGDSAKTPTILGPYLGRTPGPMPEGKKDPTWRSNQVEDGNDPANILWQQHHEWLDIWRNHMGHYHPDGSEEVDMSKPEPPRTAGRKHAEWLESWRETMGIHLESETKEKDRRPPAGNPPWVQPTLAPAQNASGGETTGEDATGAKPGDETGEATSSPPSPPPAAVAPWGNNKMPKDPETGACRGPWATNRRADSPWPAAWPMRAPATGPSPGNPPTVLSPTAATEEEKDKEASEL